MDLQALREQTRPEHEATEAIMPMLGPELTLRGYTAALKTLLPVLQGWEVWASRHCPDALRPLLANRQRSLLLQRDLEALDAPPSRRVDPLSFDSLGINQRESVEAREACFLGALYVVEGSTLGGQYIARHVETALGLLPGRGNAYFIGYGEQTGARWREVRAVLGEAPDGSLPDVVESAKRTFGLFGEAFQAMPLPEAGALQQQA